MPTLFQLNKSQHSPQQIFPKELLKVFNKVECRRWLLTTEYHETYEERTRVHDRGPENAREGFRSRETFGKKARAREIRRENAKDE